MPEKYAPKLFEPLKQMVGGHLVMQEAWLNIQPIICPLGSVNLNDKREPLFGLSCVFGKQRAGTCAIPNVCSMAEGVQDVQSAVAP